MSHKWLEIAGLRKHFGGVKALSDFSCSLERGEILGLIGPNGAGKTTLFNVLTGFISADGGTASFRGTDLLGMPTHRIARLGVARTFQHLRLIYPLSALQNVLFCFGGQMGESLKNVLLKGKASNKQETQYRKTAKSLLEGVGLADKLDVPAAELSYGQQKLLSLVCCLASGADLMLLDEPVAGIAPDTMEKVLSIISDLPKQGISVIVIEHDLDAVTQICHNVIFMDTGAKVCEGAPQEVLNNPKLIEAYLD